MLITLLAGLACLAFLARLAVMVRLHLADTGYHPIQHAVSDYAVGPTRRLAAVAGVLNAAGAGLLALALVPTFRSWGRHDEIVWLLAAYAVLAVVVIAVPTDLEGKRRTWTGVLHLLVAIASFTVGYAITSDATAGLTQLPGWAGAGQVLELLRWTTLVGLVGIVVTLVVKPLRAVFGLVERVFLGSLLLWLAVAAGQLALRH